MSVSRVDVVGVFTQNFTQVLTGARGIKLVIDEPAKVMEHPLETGAVITDHRIIMPVRIEFSVIASDYINTYREAKQLFNAGTLLSIQSRVGVYTNQLIAELPHQEDAEHYDVILMGIRFKQALFATAQFSIVPLNPQDSTTVQRGQIQQQTGPSATTVQGLFQ